MFLIAAKKLRVKQSLVKRARSVAIFSLKLKERRAKEAEKAAANSEPKVSFNAFNKACVISRLFYIHNKSFN